MADISRATSRWWHHPYTFLILPLAAMVVFFFEPAFQALWMSFFDYRENLYSPNFVGLQNYGELLSSWPFLNALQNTLLFVLGIVPTMVTLPIVMALLMNARLRGMELARALVYLPVVISMVVVGITWKWLYREEGLINYGLSFLGVDPIAWLNDTQTALWAVLLVVAWKGLAYYMMMYLAHLQSLSPQLYEAAELDGATGWRKHWHVSLPHLRPTMVLVTLISTIGALKVFTEIYVMTRGGPLKSTETLVYFIYNRAFEYLDLGTATAAGLVLAVLLMLTSILQFQLFSQTRQGGA